MERQELVSVITRRPVAFDRLRHAQVHRLPPAVRKPLVGGVAHEGVPETQQRSFGLQQALESSPRLAPTGGAQLLRKDALREIDREPVSEDARVPQHLAIGRRKAVDLRRHQRFHARGEAPDVGTARSLHELAQEQGVPGRAFDERRRIVR